MSRFANGCTAKRRLLKIVAPLVAAATSVSAQAEDAAAVGRASATVVQPISVESIQALSLFITQSDTAQAISIAPQDRENAYGQPALFKVQGERNRSYQITADEEYRARGQTSVFELAITALTVKTTNSGASNWTGQTNDSGND